MSANSHIQELVRRIRAGELRALSRAISTVEDRTPESTELLKALFPYSGNALLLGLTGSPGAGKSTLVDQVARDYRKQGKTIGIVAVDPTSPFSGGAILGDRIRMQSHYADPGIYIRSMATRGSLGGLASTTADVATVLDASGRDLVMIETVGVGQDEVDIVRLADVTIVVLVPGHGRRCADHQGRHHGDCRHLRHQQGGPRGRRARGARDSRHAVAGHAQRQLDSADREDGRQRGHRHCRVCWRPSRNIASIFEQNDRAQARRIENWRGRIAEMLRDALFQRVLSDYLSDGEATRYAAEVAEHKRDPYSLVEKIVDELGKPE